MCYNPAFPRSKNWDYKPTERMLHYNRKATGHRIVKEVYIEAMKVIWMELGVWTCINDIGTGTFMQPSNVLTFTDYGTWTTFDQGDFVGIDSTLRDTQGNPYSWDWFSTDYESVGYAFIPNSCNNWFDEDEGTQNQQKCHVHISFHQCEENGLFAQKYALETELPVYAATNDIITVYPTTKCWNMDGDIDSTNWLTNKGLYPRSIAAMICRLTSTIEETASCPTGAV